MTKVKPKLYYNQKFPTIRVPVEIMGSIISQKKKKTQLAVLNNIHDLKIKF